MLAGKSNKIGQAQSAEQDIPSGSFRSSQSTTRQTVGLFTRRNMQHTYLINRVRNSSQNHCSDDTEHSSTGEAKGYNVCIRHEV
jgi:hypothetical protein